MTAKNNIYSNKRKREAKYDSTSLIKKERKRKLNKKEFEAEL